MTALRTRPIHVEFFDSSWWDLVEVGRADGCWPWRLSLGSHGYGQTYDGVGVRLAHRVAWTLANARQIPDGMTIDHICRNRPCCNPAHLRVLSNEENGRQNGNWHKTHCKWGHEFNESNTRRDARGHRRCIACAADSQARRCR